MSVVKIIHADGRVEHKDDSEFPYWSERAKREHREYLQTNKWRQRRKRALERAGWRCVACGGASRLEVHHRTYVRLKKERQGDLEVLCRSCHAAKHPDKTNGPPT